MFTHVAHYRNEFLSQYPLSPQAVLEVTVNNPKRMAALAKPLDEIYKEIMSVRGAFTDFNFCYNNGGNVVTFNFLATQYGKLDKAVKRLSAVFKKHKSQPEIAEYSQQAVEHLLSYNIYEAMKYDFEIAKPIFTARLHLDMERWPDFKNWDPVEIDWEIVNSNFKKAT